MDFNLSSQAFPGEGFTEVSKKESGGPRKKFSVRRQAVESFGTPRRAANTVASNYGHGLTGGALVAVAGAQKAKKRMTPKQREATDTASAGAVGGVAGRAAWLERGYNIRSKGHAVERQIPEGMSRSQYQKIMRDHHKKTGVPQNTKPTGKAAVDFYRNYPEQLPAAKFKRQLGHMSGVKGGFKQAGVVSAGALGAVGLQEGYKRAKKRVSKAMPDQSAVHVMGAASRGRYRKLANVSARSKQTRGRRTPVMTFGF